MAYISAGEKKFHRLIQRHINAVDKELIAHEFDLSVRTIQDIAQGRRNNIAVLEALAKKAKENITIEVMNLDRYLENIPQLNDLHFSMRKKMGVVEGEDVDEEIK